MLFAGVFLKKGRVAGKGSIADITCLLYLTGIGPVVDIPLTRDIHLRITKAGDIPTPANLQTDNQGSAIAFLHGVAAKSQWQTGADQ